MKRLLSLFLLIVLSSFKPINDCESNFNGKFIYEDAAYKGIFIETSTNKHVEYHNNGERFIECKKEYIDNCTFKITVTKIKMPDIGLIIGDVMYVKINSFENKKLSISVAFKDLPQMKIKLIKINE
jgi:hypothetical protein